MKTITVQTGDTLWSLAERHLGNPRLWERLWRDNQTALLREQKRGETRRAKRMNGPHWIFPGTILMLP